MENKLMSTEDFMELTEGRARVDTLRPRVVAQLGLVALPGGESVYFVTDGSGRVDATQLGHFSIQATKPSGSPKGKPDGKPGGPKSPEGKPGPIKDPRTGGSGGKDGEGGGSNS